MGGAWEKRVFEREIRAEREEESSDCFWVKRSWIFVRSSFWSESRLAFKEIIAVICRVMHCN